MAITPLYDRVVVRRLAPETTTQSGIIIPDKATEKPTQGEVIAVGDGSLRDNGELTPLAVKVGDTVLFAQYAGTEITLDGEKLLIMKEADIMAVINTATQKEKAA